MEKGDHSPLQGKKTGGKGEIWGGYLHNGCEKEKIPMKRGTDKARAEVGFSLRGRRIEKGRKNSFQGEFRRNKRGRKRYIPKVDGKKGFLSRGNPSGEGGKS